MADPAQGFSEFYDEWFDRVYSYARHRTGSPVTAEEIVADTFARALASWPGFDAAKGDARSWIFAIAFRSVADHYRSQKRRRWFGLELVLGRGDGSDGAKELEAADERSGLDAGLASLTDQQREIVSLKFFGGMTNRAIAETLHLEESNVGVILFRAVRRIRRSQAGAGAGDA